ncbi:MAG: 4Fe-4S binding protein, partial [Candidatus Lokiarchaeota archaeon]|nr:4Fe-4S binding protein [Candidatus Lokiarchaeota archaeon]
YVDEEICTNCGICYNQFDCAAINRKKETAHINPNLCLGCGICTNICPINAISGGDNNEDH